MSEIGGDGDGGAGDDAVAAAGLIEQPWPERGIEALKALRQQLALIEHGLEDLSTVSRAARARGVAEELHLAAHDLRHVYGHATSALHGLERSYDRAVTR